MAKPYGFSIGDRMKRYEAVASATTESIIVADNTVLDASAGVGRELLTVAYVKPVYRMRQYGTFPPAARFLLTIYKTERKLLQNYLDIEMLEAKDEVHALYLAKMNPKRQNYAE